MPNEPWQRVVSADGTLGLALHRLSPASTEDARTAVLVSHATGFHAHCYQPLASHLPRDWLVLGIDHRGHGYTAPDPTSARLDALPSVDWRCFGDDVVTVTNWMRRQTNVDRVVGFGHSMGAAALILASALHPDWFSHLVLFEPIAPSGFFDIESELGRQNSTDGTAVPDNERHEGPSLAVGALRRRREFDSFQEAIDNYASKPPFAFVHPEVLDQYVHHGFMSTPDGITLRCTPEFESATFTAAITNGVWEAMPDATTPTVVSAGAPDPDSPGSWAPGIAQRLPNATLKVFADQTHFGPFTHLEQNAALIADTAGSGSVTS